MATQGTQPSDAMLRAGSWLRLVKEPVSPGAVALTQAVTTMILPAMGFQRTVGPAKAATVTRHVGVIIGGILREHFKGRVGAAQRRHGGPQFDDGPIGERAFWRIVSGMVKAGLVGQRLGTRGPVNGIDAGWGWEGEPTKLWPEPALVRLAATHGVTAETFVGDFKVADWIARERPTVSADDTVKVKPGGVTGAEIMVPKGQQRALAGIRERLAKLQEWTNGFRVTGCQPPVFYRVFRGDVRLHGRFYTAGAAGYTNIGREDRARVRLDDQPVAEVDISASHLSAFLGLMGTRVLPDDPYQHGDLGRFPRQAVKQWVTQTFGSGKPAGRWGRDVDAAVLAVKATDVREAALATYPALATMHAVLPADLAARVAEKALCWAVGQHLNFLEAEMLANALDAMRAWGVPALPLHDCLIVPVRRVVFAKRALDGAFWAAFGVEPRLKVTMPDGMTEGVTRAA